LTSEQRVQEPVTTNPGSHEPSDPSQASDGNGDDTRTQLRGSSLLLVGRLWSVGVNLLTQVLLARYLSTADYGAFAYALSVVALVGGLIGLGFDRAISRFLPIYDEQGDRGRFVGTLLLVVGTIVGIGAAAVLTVIGLQSVLVGTVAPDALTVTVVSIMIILAPIEALDGILTDMFAVFRSARAIFVRRYILAPALRLLVVVILVATAAGVEFLAVGYVLTGLLGVFLYVTMLPGLFRKAGVLGGPGPLRVQIPLRDIASYTVPLLTMDLVLLSMGSVDAIIVGNIHGTEEVARLKVVESTARLNALVFTTFAILFTPAAARLFARDDRATMRDLYWRSAAWIAVLSFPIFVLTFSLATPVTVFLFEERYRSSGIILATLSLARYIDAAFGPNGQTIRMFGGVKEIVAVNLVTAVIHIVLALLLIPEFGAEGAAMAILLSFVLYNLLKQIALRRVTGVPMFEMAYLPIYATIAITAVIIGVLEVVADPPLPVALLLAALASILVVALGRRSLRIAETFPELLRFPGGRFLR
jgi:O-antigen/teichoic acid export membrane protein